MTAVSSGESSETALLTTTEEFTVAPPLPAPLTPLVGREAEIAETAAMLLRPDVRLLSLTGPGGVGKTRLALALANRVANQFPDGVYFVSLAAVTEPDLVLHFMAQALRLSEIPQGSYLDFLSQALQGSQYLFVLDNFEQVRAAAPDLSTLLAACPNLKMVTTSRVALRVQSEHEFPVPPLTTSAHAGAPITDLARTEAVQLFVQRASAVRHDFRLTDANLPAVVEICRRLDGLPLAIELAATRVRLLSVQALLDRLTGRLDLLTSGPHDMPQRHRTLRSTIAWSYNLLQPVERALFRRLSVFSSGWTLEAADVVGASDSGFDILDGLATLVDHHLVQSVEQVNGQVRFFMLETIREFALEELAACDEDVETRLRHAEYCLLLAERVEPALRGAQIIEAMAAFDAEQDNFRAALTWALHNDHIDLAQRLTGALHWFWWAQNYFREGCEWLARVVERGGDASIAHAWALVGAGAMALRLGEVDQAVDWLSEGIAMHLALGDTRGAGYGRFHYAYAHSISQGPRDAIPLFEQALECFESGDDLWGVSLVQSYLGFAEYQCYRDQDKGIARLQQALAIARRLGAEPRISSTLFQLGFIAQSQGNVDRAIQYYQEAFLLEWTRKDTANLSELLLHLGGLLLTNGQPEPAVRLFGAAASTVAANSYRIYTERFREYQATLDVARATLGDELFEKTWKSGADLSLDEMLADVAAILQSARYDTAPHQATTNGAGPAHSGAFMLTPREREILRLLADGQSSHQIADALFISAHTVKRHIANILSKLGVSSRAAAVAFAFQHDLV